MQSEVYFVWDATPAAEILIALDRILQRTSCLGHSSSLISVEIVNSVAAEKLVEWRPDATKGDRMRIPYPGRVQELIAQHRKFEQSGSKIHRPSAGRSTLYAPSLATAAQPARGVFDRMIVLRREREMGPKASLRSTLSVMTALRGAIQAKGPQPPPECLSGHSPESTPEIPVRSEQPHVAVIPLAFVGSQYATGEIVGAAVLLPSTLTREERDLCWRAASSVEELTMPWGSWRVSLTDAEENRRVLQPGTWTRPHSVWATVTPFVFDRYPKDPYGEEAIAVVRQALVRVGLPEPCEVDLHYNPWHMGVPKASAFAAAPARPGKPRRYHCHARIRFEEKVAGPLIAGAGRYYGYGLFRALFDGESAK
jgi:CRISPR-associated protein Csb2